MIHACMNIVTRDARYEYRYAMCLFPALDKSGQPHGAFAKCLPHLCAHGVGKLFWCSRLLHDTNPVLQLSSCTWVLILPHPGLLEINTSTSRSHLNLLDSNLYRSSPILSLTDHLNYQTSPNSSSLSKDMIPSKFVLSLEYKPAHNTALRLFSVTFAHSPDPTYNVASSMILSSSVTFVYPSNFFIALRNFAVDYSHRVVMLVDRGQISFCVNSDYIPPVQNANLWSHDLRNADTKLNFSRNLQETKNQVTNYFDLIDSYYRQLLHSNEKELSYHGQLLCDEKKLSYCKAL